METVFKTCLLCSGFSEAVWKGWHKPSCLGVPVTLALSAVCLVIVQCAQRAGVSQSPCLQRREKNQNMHRVTERKGPLLEDPLGARLLLSKSVDDWPSAEPGSCTLPASYTHKWLLLEPCVGSGRSMSLWPYRHHSPRASVVTGPQEGVVLGTRQSEV